MGTPPPPLGPISIVLTIGRYKTTNQSTCSVALDGHLIAKLTLLKQNNSKFTKECLFNLVCRLAQIYLLVFAPNDEPNLLLACTSAPGQAHAPLRSLLLQKAPILIIWYFSLLSHYFIFNRIQQQREIRQMCQPHILLGENILRRRHSFLSYKEWQHGRCLKSQLSSSRNTFNR